MIFQIFLIQLMLGEKLTQETSEEWRNRKLKWADMYAKIVSDIIDNPENKEIRDLIIKGKHKEASDIVIRMLEEKKINLDL